MQKQLELHNLKMYGIYSYKDIKHLQNQVQFVNASDGYPHLNTMLMHDDLLCTIINKDDSELHFNLGHLTAKIDAQSFAYEIKKQKTIRFMHTRVFIIGKFTIPISNDLELINLIYSLVSFWGDVHMVTNLYLQGTRFLIKSKDSSYRILNEDILPRNTTNYPYCTPIINRPFVDSSLIDVEDSWVKFIDDLIPGVIL